MKLSVYLFIYCFCAFGYLAHCSRINCKQAGGLLERLRRDSYNRFQLKSKQHIDTENLTSRPFPSKGGPAVHNLPPLRKGEYICGDKICKLKPGEVPKGCHGVCQYPI